MGHKRKNKSKTIAEIHEIIRLIITEKKIIIEQKMKKDHADTT